MFGEFGIDVIVDGFVRRLIRERLKRPPLLAAFEDGFPTGFLGDLFPGWREVTRIGGAIVNPALEVGDGLIAEFGTGLGHLQILVFVPDGTNEQRGARIARLDDIAGFPTGLPACP